ncbi:MAG: cobalt ECF transporter T component CbiQ [Geminicoccaceae bacterium]
MSRDLLAPLDPRTRLLGALALILAVLSLDGPAAGLLAVAAAFGLALAAGWRPAGLARRLAHVEGIMAALFLVLPFTTPGTTVLHLGPLAATSDGLLLALGLMLRVTASALIVLALLATVEPIRLGQALARLRTPVRLVQLLLLVLRYGALLRAELRRMREAARARGFRGGLSIHALRSLGWLAGMTLVRALERAERVEEGMRLRLWQGALPVAAPDRLGRADAAFGTGVLALALLAVIGIR